MKQLLLVDWDQTLCFDRYWRSLPEESRLIVQDDLFGGNNPLVHEWMRGEHTAEYVNSYLATRLAMSYDELWQLFVRDCETMHVEHSLLDRLNALRDHCVVVLTCVRYGTHTHIT